MIGPGKYDDICTALRETCFAEGAIVIVFNGTRGSGFSAQLSPELTSQMPDVLRHVANQIEASQKTLPNRN